jgi:hypothetical protein
MTQPLDLSELPLVDAGNMHARTDVPTTMITGKIPVPGGEIGLVTIRQCNTTITIPLTREQAGTWAGMLAQLRDMLSGTGLVVPGRAQAAQIAGAARNTERPQ